MRQINYDLRLLALINKLFQFFVTSICNQIRQFFCIYFIFESLAKHCAFLFVFFRFLLTIEGISEEVVVNSCRRLINIYILAIFSKNLFKNAAFVHKNQTVWNYIYRSKRNHLSFVVSWTEQIGKSCHQIVACWVSISIFLTLLGLP